MLSSTTLRRSTLRRAWRPLLTHHAASLRRLHSEPLVITATPAEKSTSRLSLKNLQLATRALHRDGLVVIENVLDHAILDTLNAKMLSDAAYLVSLGDAGPFNYNKGNIQQDPPLTLPHFHPSLYLNPLVTQLTSSLLGPRPRLSFISGNTAVQAPTPQRQPVHTDADFDHPDCPFALVVNIPLVAAAPANGATEVWLGTHAGTGLADQEGAHGERASGRIRAELLEKRREVRPPCRPEVRKGSVVVRDLRLWHAGCPNETGEARVMLAMIHFARWYRNPMTVEFAEELAPVLEEFGGDLEIQATLLPEGEVLERYLNKPFGNAYDFNQRERLEGVF